MLQTTETDKNLIEASFYENDFLFSYSSLNTLITAPAAFYKEYVLGQKTEEFKKYLLEGTLIHYLILENQGFDAKFLVASANLPSENTVAVLDRVYKEHYLSADNTSLVLSDFQLEIDDILRELNLHQTVKDDVKRLAKIIEPRAEEYFEFLKLKNGRTIIDSGLLDVAARRAEIVKRHMGIRDLLGLDVIADGRTIGVYNELPISMTKEDTGLPFGFKGILDNVVINTTLRTLRINDFKTTGKSLVDFKESIDFWNYWLQATMYLKLVKHMFKGFIDDSWSIEFRFIVFDKYDQMYPFLVSDGTLAEWSIAFDKTIEEATYHYTNREYSLPYDFALGNVIL